MASLFPETEFFHEHVVLTKTLPLSQQVKLSHGLIKFPPPKKDNSAEVFLSRAPTNFSIDEKEAAKRSVNAFYSKTNKNKTYVIILDVSKPTDLQSPSSANISLLFIPYQHSQESKSQEQLQKYVSERKQKFLERVGHWGVVQNVNLHSSVTSHLDNMPFAALRFAGESDDIHGFQHSGRYVFILRTEGGFWEISWRSSLDDLDNNKNFFADVIKSVAIKFPDGKVFKQTLARETASSASQKKELELDFSSLIAKLLGGLSSH